MFTCRVTASSSPELDGAERSSARYRCARGAHDILPTPTARGARNARFGCPCAPSIEYFPSSRATSPPTAAPMANANIPDIGKYRIVELVGEGAMGVVYRALDTVLHRTVAIKVMNESIARQEELRQRFLH